jgi:hypothetical protein
VRVNEGVQETSEKSVGKAGDAGKVILPRPETPIGLVLVAIVVLQATLISITFPATELWTQKPLFFNDAAYHWYQMKAMVNVAESGKLSGYDPFFDAGYIVGVDSNGSAAFPAAMAVLFHQWFNEIIVYKLLSVLAALVAPICVPVAFKMLGFSRGPILIGSVVGFLLWWASWFRWMHTTGMVAFVLASYLALPYVGAIIRYLAGSGRTATLFALGCAGAIGLFYHPLFPVPVAIAIACYLVMSWRTLELGRVAKMLVGPPILSLLPNLVWLYPMYHHGKVADLTTLPYMQVVDVRLIWQEFMGFYGRGNAQGSLLYGPLAVASLLACISVAERRDRRIAYAFTASGGILILIGAVGAVVPFIRDLEPNRFRPTGYLFLTIPAALGLLHIVRLASGTHGRGAVRICAKVFVIAYALIVLRMLNEVRREVSYADIGHYGAQPPEVKGLGPYSQWALDWLNRNTTREGRILFEDSLGRIFDGAHLLGYYAYESDREFIGGPFPFQGFAGFWDEWLFNKQIGHIDIGEMQKYFDIYNVGWIVVHTDASKRYFDSMPGIVPLTMFREVKTYRIDRPLNFFISGSGRIVRRGHNVLDLADMDGSEVILAYHFYPGLKADPPATISPVHFLDDPNSFVRIVNPPSHLRLELE